MNRENFINLKTKVYFSKQIINLLFSERIFSLISEKDKNEIKNIRNSMDSLLLTGIIITTASYFAINKFILNNKKLSIVFNSRIKIMKTFTDFIFILGFSYTIGKIHNNYLNTKIFIKLNTINKNYKYLIKNSILTNDLSIKENKFISDLNKRMHQYDYSQIYFVGLLIFRLFI